MMLKHSLTRIAAATTLALGLAACSSDGGSGGFGPGGNGGGGGGGNNSGQLILDEAQQNVSGLLTGLGSALAVAGENPLSALVTCLDPTLNDLLDGPDALLSGLLGGLSGTLQTQDPNVFATALLAGGEGLAGGLMSLAENLPVALLSLVQPSIAANGCKVTGGTGTPLDQLIGLFSGGGNPFAGTPLAGLGTIGGAGTPAGGPTGTPLDAILGPLLAIQGGNLNGELLDLLGAGLTTLGTEVTGALPPEVQGVPVLGPVFTLLANTVTDVGLVLNELEQPTSAAQTSDLLNNLLSNVTGILTSLDPTGTLQTQVQPQIDVGINTLTSVLEDNLLSPLLGQGGLVPTLLNPLGVLTCTLLLTGDCDDVSSLSFTNPTSAFGDIRTTIENSPLAPLSGLFAILGL